MSRRSTNVAVERQDIGSCSRCGVRVRLSHPSRKARTRGICVDCRSTDPDYVEAIATGTPIIDRFSDTFTVDGITVTRQAAS